MPVKVEPKEGEDMMSHLNPLSAIPKGDLFIRFNIVFPVAMKIEHKSKIVEILRKNAAETVN